MSVPIVFVGTYRIPPGDFATTHSALADMADFVRANAPRVVMLHHYVNADRSEGTTIYVHPDAESLAQHLAAAAQRIASGSRMVDVQRIELYGPVPDAIVAGLREGGSYPITVSPHLLGFGPTEDHHLDADSSGR